MAILLQMWDALVSNELNPTKQDLALLSDDEIQTLITESEKEQQKVRTQLIEGVVDRPKIMDKQQFVQVNQAILIRLLDKIYSYEHSESGDACKKMSFLYNFISLHLEETLNFIEDFFSNYFDRNEKVPASYLTRSLEELRKQLEKLKNYLSSSSNINQKLKEILINNFDRFCQKQKNSVTYNELIYQKDLMSELLTAKTLCSESSIKEVLFYFNFNEADYVAYLYQQLTSLIDQVFSKDEQITVLRFEQKNINQLTTKLNSSLSIYMPSLKDQVNHWIEEEIKFIEKEQIPVKQAISEEIPSEKIHTSFFSIMK